MNFFSSLGLLLLFLCWELGAAVPKTPKLVVAIAVDQFRYDYLTRFRGEYNGGLARLLTVGAVFSNARYEHFPTVTAIGHATFLTGATPSISGIVGNDWYDRAEGRSVTSVSDPKTRLLGGSGPGSSPHRLLVSTVGDELKIVNPGRSRVVGISLKDRAAVLPAGHTADGAYWFDGKTGNFVSSTFYFPDLPGWAKDFNAGRPADRYSGAEWLDHQRPKDPAKLYEARATSPCGNELIEAFAERAITAEALGQRDAADLLAVSFSSNDYIGHRYGPDSPEVREISIRTDRLFEKLFRFLDARVGLANVLVVLTGDHGVAPTPEAQAARRMPGGRMPARIVQDTVQAALVKKYGEGKWISSPSEHSLYLNLDDRKS